MVESKSLIREEKKVSKEIETQIGLTSQEIKQISWKTISHHISRVYNLI